MSFKNYILSKFIYLLPIESGFFFKTGFEKKIKLSNELIKLNYNRHSPYKNPSFIFLMQQHTLYIWFFKKKIFSQIILPEAYLVFDFFKERHDNTIIIIKTLTLYKIIIIKDSQLINAYALTDIDDALIEAEMNKYSILSSHRINANEYEKLVNKALQNIAYSELYKWNRVKINKEELFPKMLNLVAYPLSFLLVFMMGIHLFHTNQLENRLDVAEKNYLISKEKNSDVKEKIIREAEKEKKWVDFIRSELSYGDTVSLFLKIENALKNEKITLLNFSIVGSKVRIEIYTEENFIIGLTALNKVDALINITIKNANRKRNSVRYEADVLARGLVL